MKSGLVRFVVATLGAMLLIAGCAQAAPPPTPTIPPAAPTKAAEPTKPAAAPTQAPAPTKAPTAQAAAPAPKTSFPEKGKTITLMIAFPPGGSNDVAARLLAPLLEKDLGVPVQVTNKAGAGGQVAATELANSKPDGYLLGHTTLPATSVYAADPERKATFTRKSFEPVAAVLVTPTIASVRADKPYQNMKDLIDAAKARPGVITAGTAGILSTGHMGVLKTQLLAAAVFRIVHFEGGAPSQTALMGGHVDVVFGSEQEPLSGVRSGQVRVLGVMGKEESKYYPGVKTFEGQGIREAQGVKPEVTTIMALSAPAGTPRDVVEILSGAIRRAMALEEWKKKSEEAGLSPRYMSPAELAVAWADAESDAPRILELAKQ